MGKIVAAALALIVKAAKVIWAGIKAFGPAVAKVSAAAGKAAMFITGSAKVASAVTALTKTAIYTGVEAGVSRVLSKTPKTVGRVLTPIAYTLTNVSQVKY